MSEFIRAIEFDQTPNKVMMQMSSELAEEANKKAQLSMTMQKMQADREKALNDKYGEFQKMALDQVKGAKGELVNSMMSRFITNLGQALNESNGDIGVFTKLGFDKALTGLISDRAASDQILALGEEFAKKNSAIGIDQEAVRAATAKYVLTNLGSGLDPEKYAQFIQSEIDDNPSLYGDPAKQLEILKSAKSAKGDTLERKVTLDPTGTLKKVLDIKTERKPWEKIDVFKASNGVSTDLPRVTFETIDAPMDPAAKLVKGGVQFKSVTEDVYRNFLAQGPAVKSTVAAGAKDVVHSVNANQFGLDTRGLSRQEFQAAKEKYPYLVDPFNEGVLDVYGKHVVTKLIEGDYDKDGFKVPENLATELRKDNPPKTTNNTTINMPGANPNTPYIDVVGLTMKKIEADQKRTGKNYTHTQVNSLPTAVKDVALTLAKRDLPEAIRQNLGSESFKIVTRNDKPAIVVAREIKDEEGNVIKKVNDFLAYIDDGANQLANGTLGNDSEMASVQPITTTRAQQNTNQSTQTINQDAYRKMSLPERKKFLASGGKVK